MSTQITSVWRWYFVALLVATVAYLRTPDTWLQTICYDTIAISGAVAMAIGVWIHRPPGARLWLAFALSQAVMVGGDFVYALYARAFHQTPYPAPADGFYLSASILGIVVLTLVTRRRLPERDLGGVIEASIVAGAFALISWVYLLKPVTQSHDLTSIGKLVAISYPVLDLFLFTLLARMAVGGGARNGAFRLLIAGMTAYLLADFAWALTDHFQFVANTLTSHVMDDGYLLAFGLYGVAGLHPGIRKLATPVEISRRTFSRARLIMLGTATMIAPVLLVVQARGRDDGVSDAHAIAVGCAVMFLLVVARLASLLRQVEGQASTLEQQKAELEALAQRDALTGLANRRAWEQALTHALQLARTTGEPLALAVIDLDLFKLYNDAHGHQAGDRLLKEAAVAWTSVLRGGDLMARYGGEEFTILLPGTQCAEAETRLRRLRPLTPAGQTFSAGVALWDGRESSDELFARADAALYQAKTAGRNRIAVAETTSATDRARLEPQIPHMSESSRSRNADDRGSVSGVR